MRFWKPRAKRLAALVCALALTASLLPTAVFATEPEPTPTPEPTPVVETTSTPDPSESPVNTDATVSTSAPDTGTGSTSAPEATPAGNTDDTKEPEESPEPSEEPTDDTTESGEESTETTDSTTVPSEEGTETTDSTTVPSEEPVESPEPVQQPEKALMASAPALQADENGKTIVEAVDGTADNFYADPDNMVWLSVSGGTTKNQNVTFIINIDGEKKGEVEVQGVAKYDAHLTINAPLYDISTETSGYATCTRIEGEKYYDLVNAWAVVGDNDSYAYTVTIDLTTPDGVKNEDKIRIEDGEQNYYGTFFWINGGAVTDAHERTLMVYVNDSSEPVWTQQITTPIQVSASDFWFEPNLGVYTSDVTLEPAYNLAAWNDEVKVYLTTKCLCGNENCQCLGGCACEPGCEKPECNPVAGENSFVTPYGTITYMPDDGSVTSIRRKLKVEFYVNGQFEQETKEFYINNAKAGNLKFDPEAGEQKGYYFLTQADSLNSFDILTRKDADDVWERNGSDWEPGVGTVTLATTSETDQNVLRIYLWTFNNYTMLDIERDVGDPMENVTGYTISFMAPDPENGGQEKLYTYEATSFLVGQRQVIPLGRQVTLTADCKPYYEATRWEAHNHDDDVLFYGENGGQTGLSPQIAYGNTVYLTAYGSSVGDHVVVRIADTGEVTAPSEDVVEDLLKQIEQLVNVKCANVEATHSDTEKTYGLLENGYAYDVNQQLGGDSVSDYTVTLTIKADTYLSQYNKDVDPDHTLASGEGDKTITLRYRAQKWVVDTETPVTFNVTCEETANESVDLTKSIVSVKRGETTLAEDDIPATLKVGDVVTYQVEVKNTGNVALSDLTITDTLTAQGTEPVDLDDDDGDFAWTREAGNWIGTVSNVELGENDTKTYKYTYTVVDGDKGKTITNTAAIDGDDPIDEDEIKTEVENPDVKVTKSLTAIIRNGESVTPQDDTELKVGDEITYTITVKNTGNVALEGLILTDTFNGYNKPEDSQSLKWEGKANNWTASLEIPELPKEQENTYTYTYTVVQADADKTLINSAVVTGKDLDPDDPPPQDEEEHEVKDDGKIKLQPADITIYMGGYDGYEAVVDDDGKTHESNTLPEPGFYITLPETVQEALSDADYSGGTAADLSNMITVTATTNSGEDRSWTLQKYSTEEESTTLVTGEGGSAQEHFLYRIVPEADQPAIRVVFTNPETGEQITSDVFDPTAALYDSYDMALYTGDVNVEAISLQIKVKDKTFYCGYDAQNSKSGKLTVRYTSSAATTTMAVSNLDAEVAEEPNAFYAQFANTEQKFYINEQDTLQGNVKTGVEVDQNNVYLLADNVIESEGLAEMQERAQQAAGFENTGAFAKYFDLVDIHNGNAWLTPQDGTEVKVYWPYPAGTDQNTKFNLYHFVDLDREMLVADAENEVANSDMDSVTIEKTETGITFKTSSFSPFVLVWDTTRPSGGGDEPSGGDDGNNGNNNNNNNNTNNNQNKSTASASASASAAVTAPAAPAAAVIPQTGDDMPVGLLAGLALVAAGGLAALLVLRKRRSDR